MIPGFALAELPVSCPVTCDSIERGTEHTFLFHSPFSVSSRKYDEQNRVEENQHVRSELERVDYGADTRRRTHRGRGRRRYVLTSVVLSPTPDLCVTRL